MYEWHKQIQIVVDEIDECIRHHHDEALTLQFLSRKLGYSKFHTTRKFKKISGMQFRDYLRLRKLAYALKEVRDSEKNILDIAFDFSGEVPPQMLMIDVPEAEYIVFEHGPFDYEQENRSVEGKLEKAMATFDFSGTGYCFDTSPGRIIYFFFNPERFWKYIRPVRKS